jgi:hypothetical protein
MEFNATIDLIIRDLEEAVKIIDDLKKYPGIPGLQVELAKAKCKSAGEVIAMLKSMELTASSVSGNTVQKVIEPEPPAAAEKKKTVKTEKKEPPAEPLKNETPTEEVIIAPEIKNIQSSSAQPREQASSVIGDTFGHLSARFNEQHVTRKPEDELFKSKPLSSLSEAIGINDRFLFVREIFDGKNDAYSHAIDRLDKAETIDDARAVIMSYTGDNKENEAVKQLIELVKRKLHSNE